MMINLKREEQIYPVGLLMGRVLAKMEFQKQEIVLPMELCLIRAYLILWLG
ncbi:hypothetical protein D3C72_1257570 [compost metagenome]